MQNQFGFAAGALSQRGKKILEQLDKQGLAEHFLTVGTQALYAYETAAGVRVMPDALATGTR